LSYGPENVDKPVLGHDRFTHEMRRSY